MIRKLHWSYVCNSGFIILYGFNVGHRGATIQVPHNTICISIQRSRFNAYLDTYLNTVMMPEGRHS